MAKPQTLSIGSENYFKTVPAEIRHAHLSCTFNSYDILSAAPADFDGDGGMDILVVAKDLDTDKEVSGSKVWGLVLWGEHDESNNTHVIRCDESKMIKLEMDLQPLVVDANGDNIADLFTSVNQTYGIFQFSGDRTHKPEFVSFDTERKPNLKFPHSNAFVDLNNDGNADIFVTSKQSIELWENDGTKGENHFKYMNDVAYPDGCSNVDKCVGQAVFADFDLDGTLDVLIPTCMDEQCEGSRIYFSSVKETFLFHKAAVDLGKWKFDPISDDDDNPNVYRSLSPHVGDINLDGYPDLLMRMRHIETDKVQMQVLLNVGGVDDKGKSTRKFWLQPEIMDGINDTVLATFYDLYENGMEDMIVVKKVGKDMQVAAYTNLTQDSDAYFVKVIVLSGMLHCLFKKKYFY